MLRRAIIAPHKAAVATPSQLCVRISSSYSSARSSILVQIPICTRRRSFFSLATTLRSEAKIKRSNSITTSNREDSPKNAPPKSDPNAIETTTASPHRLFFDSAAIQLGVKSQEDWYNITVARFKTIPGSTRILKNDASNSSSLYASLAKAYPEHEWLPWRFSHVPRSFWTDPSTHRRFFDWAAKQIGVKSMEDWYHVRNDQIDQLGGGGLLRAHYNTSLQQALASVYPEYEWLPWRFPSVPSGFWNDKSNQRRFFDWAAKQLGVRSMDDWYDISSDQILALGGHNMVTRKYASLQSALMAVYPEHEWLPWRFAQVPSSYWKENPANHRRFFDWAAAQLGIENMEGWYDISTEQIQKLGGHGLLVSQFNNSLHKALSAVYPEHDWLPWRFRHAPPGYWRDTANQKRFFDWAATQLGIRTMEDWYDVPTEKLHELGGRGFLCGSYAGSLQRALASVYPEYQWLPWRFNSVRRGYWTEDADNQRQFFEWASKQLGVKTMDDWYSVTLEQFAKVAGWGLLGQYGGSLQRALQAVYPQHEWQSWRFNNFVPSLLGDDTELERYMAYLAQHLGIKHLDDWYRVSVAQARELGGYKVVEQRGGLYAVLKRLYPEHDWEEERFSKVASKKSSQRWLFIMLQKLLPNEEIFEEYHHPSLRFAHSGEPMTLDIWIPSMSLAFEYQGTQHYRDMHMFGDPSKLKLRDAEKRSACAQSGITLISVPFWWNRSMEDLAATILDARPDILRNSNNNNNNNNGGGGDDNSNSATSLLVKAAANGTPLSAQQRQQQQQQHQHQHASSKSRRRKQASAAAEGDMVMLAGGTWNKQDDPTGWWISEKLDGFRAYWDGEELRSRSGNSFDAPQWFKAALPRDMQLDGELWMGRGKYQDMVQMFLQATRVESARDAFWRSVKFCIFDFVASTTTTTTTTTTTMTTTALPCEARLRVLLDMKFDGHQSPSVEVVPARQCLGREDLDSFFDEIVVRGGGEGVVLRKPGSMYTRGRSSSLLKLKPVNDTEVKFIERHPNRQALRCEQLDDGQRVLVTCTQDVYHNPPPRGAIITVTYESVWTNGRLRNAQFLRVRHQAHSR